jgi:hypothetical protein
MSGPIQIEALTGMDQASTLVAARAAEEEHGT